MLFSRWVHEQTSQDRLGAAEHRVSLTKVGDHGEHGGWSHSPRGKVKGSPHHLAGSLPQVGEHVPKLLLW